MGKALRVSTDFGTPQTVVWSRSFRGSAWEPIDGPLARGMIYTPTADDIGATLRAECTSREHDAALVVSAEVGPVLIEPALLPQLAQYLKSMEVSFEVSPPPVAVSPQVGGDAKANAAAAAKAAAAANVKKEFHLNKEKLKLRDKSQGTFAKGEWGPFITIKLDGAHANRLAVSVDSRKLTFTYDAPNSQLRNLIAITIRLFRMLLSKGAAPRQPDSSLALISLVKQTNFQEDQKGSRSGSAGSGGGGGGDHKRNATGFFSSGVPAAAATGRRPSLSTSIKGGADRAAADREPSVSRSKKQPDGKPPGTPRAPSGAVSTAHAGDADGPPTPHRQPSNAASPQSVTAGKPVAAPTTAGGAGKAGAGSAPSAAPTATSPVILDPKTGKALKAGEKDSEGFTVVDTKAHGFASNDDGSAAWSDDDENDEDDEDGVDADGKPVKKQKKPKKPVATPATPGSDEPYAPSTHTFLVRIKRNELIVFSVGSA